MESTFFFFSWLIWFVGSGCMDDDHPAAEDWLPQRLGLKWFCRSKELERGSVPKIYMQHIKRSLPDVFNTKSKATTNEHPGISKRRSGR